MSTITIDNIEYATRSGDRLHLDIHLPANPKGPMPMVLGIVGGGWLKCTRQSVPRFLVEHGFAMACIDYRVSSVAPAPANVLDCKLAIRWLREHAEQYGYDAERMGIYGGSAGGHLAALLGVSAGIVELNENAETAAEDHPVQAVCAACGPMDLNRIGIPDIRAQYPKLYEVTEAYLGGPVTARAELARLVSPLSYATRVCPPMLLVHGAADPVVPPEESVLFHDALQSAGADSTLRLYDGVEHTWVLEAQDDIVSFFRNTLLPSA